MSAPPDLPGVVSAFADAGALHVIIGGFAVIAHRHIRATEDVDLLIPEDPANDDRVLKALEVLEARHPSGRAIARADVATRPHLRADSATHGLIDLLHEGEPPLDFTSVHDSAIVADVRGVPMRFAGLESLVAFKRLAGRPRDRYDLEALEEIHGPLPIRPIPGLDAN